MTSVHRQEGYVNYSFVPIIIYYDNYETLSQHHLSLKEEGEECGGTPLEGTE